MSAVETRPPVGVRTGVVGVVGGALALVGVGSCSSSSAPPDPGPDPRIPDAVASITGTELVAHVGVVSHDSMRGRRTPGSGFDAAARYIERELEAAGVAPGAAGSWRHHYQIFIPVPDTGYSVIGIVPGSDPAFRDEYVVLSAHMDHLGVNAFLADSIFNGADDNGSGTAAILEVAEALGELTAPPRRSIIFAAFGAEERGLIGSRAYVADGLPAGEVVANLNLDMVSRNSPDSVAILRSPPGLGAVADAVAARHPELGLTVAPDPWPGLNLIARSDQWSFIREGVGGLLMTSGLHEDYHEGSDEVALIDGDKLERVSRLALLILLELADPDVWSP